MCAPEVTSSAASAIQIVLHTCWMLCVWLSQYRTAPLAPALHVRGSNQRAIQTTAAAAAASSTAALNEMSEKEKHVCYGQAGLLLLVCADANGKHHLPQPLSNGSYSFIRGTRRRTK